MTTLAELENRIYEPSLKLWLPLSHTDGTVVDKSAYGTPFTLASVPYWTPLGWVMDGANDEILATAAVTTHLRFTSEDFSVIIRVKHNDSGSSKLMMAHFEYNQSGWYFKVSSGEGISLFTFQSGANQSTLTANSAVVDGEVYTLGFSRIGTSVRIYVNGVDKTDIAGTHTNPVTPARIFGVGSSGYSLNEMQCTYKCAAVWSRGLAPQEHAEMHQMMSEVFP